jgi:hypothetical protein
LTMAATCSEPGTTGRYGAGEAGRGDLVTLRQLRPAQQTGDERAPPLSESRRIRISTRTIVRGMLPTPHRLRTPSLARRSGGRGPLPGPRSGDCPAQNPCAILRGRPRLGRRVGAVCATEHEPQHIGV